MQNKKIMVFYGKGGISLEKLTYEFYHRPCFAVAKDLIGKVICHGDVQLRITETEIYWGESDTACHASRGRTKRTEVLYMDAGTIYVYLCYGIHWLLNIITGDEHDPQGVLIRCCAEAPGPGKLTKKLGITGELNRKSILNTPDFWIGDDGFRCEILRDKRVGIGYASQEDQDKLWRFIMGKQTDSAL